MPKRWTKPEITVLTRPTANESALTYCKSSIDNITGDPSIYRAKCDGGDATCFACYRHLVSS